MGRTQEPFVAPACCSCPSYLNLCNLWNLRIVSSSEELEWLSAASRCCSQSLMPSRQQKANWCGDLGNMAGRSQPSGGRIDPKTDYIVRLLICSKEKSTTRIDGEVARCFAAGGNMLQECEFACAWIY